MAPRSPSSIPQETLVVSLDSWRVLYRPRSLSQVLTRPTHLGRSTDQQIGPDYVSMTAGEAENPRKYLPRAYNGVFYRLTTFFVMGSLCVGIVVPYNDPDLLQALSDARPGAGSSPYVIAMARMGIPILPHIVNFLILTAIFSAGNSYVYCASRTLFGLALEGKAPRFFTHCTKAGVPIWSVTFTLAIALLGTKFCITSESWLTANASLPPGVE